MKRGIFMENENKVVQETTAGGAVEVNTGQPAEKSRCPNCQALLNEDQTFCPECGTSLKKLCQKCGAKLQDGQVFCAKCGQKNTGEIAQATSSIEQFNQSIINNGNKANMKKKILSIIGVVLLVAATISYFIFQSMRASEYKENAKTFCTTVLSSAVNLEAIGNEIQTEWHDYIYDRWSIYNSVDDAVAGALSNKSDEISKAKTEKVIIDDLYSKLKKPVNRTEEIEEICDAVKVLYDEYKDFYDGVTNPSGNYNSFKSEFEKWDNSTVDAYKDLKELCDDLN